LPSVVITDARYICGPTDGNYVQGGVRGDTDVDLTADVLNNRSLSIGAVHFTGDRFGLDVRGGGGVGTVVIRDSHGTVLARRALALSRPKGSPGCG
jgi:hypothetical protein